MFKIKHRNLMLLAAGLIILVLAGCSATPDEQQLKEWENIEGPGEMKPGAGLLSGDDGEFTLYSSKKGGLFPKEGETEATNSSAEQSTESAEIAGTATGSAAGSQAASQSGQASEKAQEFEEFQEYQQWKKGVKSSADYREFLEWKEFKAYQEWKKRQE
ncbi:MAG: hypothetical protein JRF56_10000 [Deltaproteobacteria bacterium]|jgi:hypothetical protein|nr:hypothetical protein [Deltaproteobacteria bacterium]